MNKSPLVSSVVALCVALFTTPALPAQTRPLVTITVNANDPIRDDITPATFGSGVEHKNPQFRTAMNPAGGPTATWNAMAGLNLGLLRFPNGTAALHYTWSHPGDSYRPPGVLAADILTPAEILDFTAPASLDLERLFQVNTFSYRGSGLFKYINQYNASHAQPAVIVPANLTAAARYAASWVAQNLAEPAGRRVTYWEVGNEDWAWWSPEQYKTIFNAFAVEMKAANPAIKLLATTLTQDYTLTGGVGTNGPDWTARLVAAGIRAGDIHALSEHQYLSGGIFAGSLETQRSLQTQNMLARVASGARTRFLQQEIRRLAPAWKIWVTEFNVAQQDAAGNLVTLQDLGHGLVIADWTGRLLEQGVEKLFFHSLDHHPAFALVQYVNQGGTIASPRTTVPAYAFGIYPQEFGPKMVTTSLADNPVLSSPNSGTYAQVSAYASIRESDQTLRLVVVNRHTTGDVELKIRTEGRSMKNAPAKFKFQRLYSSQLSDSNGPAFPADFVKWTAPVEYNSSSWAITGVVVPKHSVSFFVIPLQ